MPSKIDASKPADVVAAVKADLRTNLAHAKTELEHMGFYDPAKNITGRQRVDELLALLAQLQTLNAENAVRIAQLEQF